MLVAARLCIIEVIVRRWEKRLVGRSPGELGEPVLCGTGTLRPSSSARPFLV